MFLLLPCFAKSFGAELWAGLEKKWPITGPTQEPAQIRPNFSACAPAPLTAWGTKMMGLFPVFPYAA